MGEKNGLPERPPKYEVNRDFIAILESAGENDYASFKYVESPGYVYAKNNARYPTLPETISHLKLLKAFGELKTTIVGTRDLDSRESTKKWQAFVTNASRRFILFMTALKKSLDRLTVALDDESELYSRAIDATAIQLLDNLLPPLDVVMVWHAFLLNPRS